jgi:hypothetical protein
VIARALALAPHPLDRGRDDAIDQATRDTPLSRRALLLGLYVLGMTNGAIGYVIGQPSLAVTVASLATINLIVLLAVLAGLRLAGHVAPVGCHRADLAAGVLCALLILVPSGRISWAAVGLLALYSLVAHRDDRFAVAAASVFLALAFKQSFGTALMALLAEPLTIVDAVMVSGLLDLVRPDGIVRVGNVITAPDGYRLAIMLGCSSLHNLSIGLLCWVAITRSVRPAWRRADGRTVVTIMVATVGLNVLRMTLMGFGPAAYDVVHGPIGNTVFDMAVMANALAITLWGFRDALAHR